MRLSAQIVDVHVLKKRNTGLKRCMNELEVKLSFLEVERALLRCARVELSAEVAKIGRDGESVLKAVLKQSMDGVAHMVMGVKVQLKVSPRCQSGFLC